VGSSLSITVFENAIEALYRRDYDQAEKSIERNKEVLAIEKEAVSASQSMSAVEAANLRLIIESVRRTAEYDSDIAEIVLNLTVESTISQQFKRK